MCLVSPGWSNNDWNKSGSDRREKDWSVNVRKDWSERGWSERSWSERDKQLQVRKKIPGSLVNIAAFNVCMLLYLTSITQLPDLHSH